jgi:hypothetical protein
MLGQKFTAALTMAIVRTFENCGRLKMDRAPKIGPSSGSGLVPPQTAPWVFRASLLWLEVWVDIKRFVKANERSAYEGVLQERDILCLRRETNDEVKDAL